MSSINVPEMHTIPAENDFACCPSCHLDENQKTFTSEIALHFPGIGGLNKPIVWVFPKISVCLECGQARFMVPERELEFLRTGAPVEGASVLLGGGEE